MARSRCRLHEPDAIHRTNGKHLDAVVHRFAYSIHPSGECWQWTGNRNEDGYGEFNAHGSTWMAHRWSYAYFIGGHGNRQQLDHVCANPLCARPDHLFPVTAKENSRLRTRRLKRPGEWITPARYIRPWSPAAERFALGHNLPHHPPQKGQQ